MAMYMYGAGGSLYLYGNGSLADIMTAQTYGHVAILHLCMCF